MLPTVVVQLFAVVGYLALAAAIAYGRPQIPRGGGSGERRTVATASRASEAAWLASIAIVLLYPIGAALLPGVLLDTPWALSFPGDEAVQVIGLALVLIGAGLVGAAFRALGRFATVEIRIAPDHEIVRAGPYAGIRHSMYTANMLLALGISLAYLSLLTWIPVVLIVLLAFRRSRAEETLFLSSPEHGPAYSRYRAETGRFFPRWDRARKEVA